MATHPVYEKLLQELYEGGELTRLESQVVELLKAAHGEPLTRYELVHKVFGYIPVGNLSNNSDDRKIRKAIESLRRKGATMIVATSAAAGYCIDNSVERAEEMAGEMEKRARELHALAERIRAALRPVEVPKEIIDRARPIEIKQISFLETGG